MIIKILGTGCPKCKLLEQMTRDTVAELWIQADIIKINNMEDIMQYDIMATPALVINEKIVITGRIPSKEVMKHILLNEK